MFTNKDEAIYYIENIKRKEKRTNLNRIQEALNMLGNPQNAYKVIHVAGTNGKGSTVAYLTNILCEAGFNVGSFISPYVITFNERIMYNLNYISDDEMIAGCTDRIGNEWINDNEWDEIYNINF